MSIFYFVAFGIIANKSLPNSILWSFCLFPSKSFIVWRLTFMSFTHFELIFVYGVKYSFNFILLHVGVRLFPAQFVEKTVFPHWMVLAPLSKITWSCKWGLFLGSLFNSIGLYAVPHYFDYCSFVVCFKIMKLWIFQLYSFSRFLWLCRVLWDCKWIWGWVLFFFK